MIQIFQRRTSRTGPSGLMKQLSMVPPDCHHERPIFGFMFMVWSQSATINDPWRCAAPSNWLGNRVERAKCLKKLQQGLQASTCLASARQRPRASTTRARCLEHASRSYAWTTTQFHEPSGKRLRVKGIEQRNGMAWCLWEARPEPQVGNL